MSVSPTVCVLDDDPSVAKALGRLLASEGVVAEPFTEPARFLAYAQSHEVPVAVLDVCMPGMTGLSVQSALQAVSPRTRVIVITAEDDPSHRFAALGGGASAFFLKPLNDDAFLAAVRTALQGPGRPGRA